MFRRVVTSILALALLAGYGCPVRGRVLMVGDSNVLLSAPTYIGLLDNGSAQNGWIQPAPGYLLTFKAIGGAGFKDVQPADPNAPNWIPTLESVRTSHTFDAVVLALGVNDGINGYCVPRPTVDQKIDALIAALPPSVPIIVLDAAHASAANYNMACIIAVNDALQDAIHRHGERVMVRINSNAALSTAGIAYPSGWFTDGLHYRPAAQYVLAEQIRLALEAVL